MKQRGQYAVGYSALAAGAQPSCTYRFDYQGPVEEGGISPVQIGALATVAAAVAVVGGVSPRRARSG